MSSAPSQPPPTALPARPLSPLKPRPGLFYVLCAVFAIWIGFLAWLYATTVYPLRHESTPPSQTH